MAESRRDAKSAFVKNVQRAAEHLGDGQYGACASTASELTHFSCLLGDKTWVFASEVMETVFGNMYHLSKHHGLPEKDEKSIRSKLIRAMDDVPGAIESGEDDQVFPPLAQMRFDATMFQMSVWTSQPRVQGGAD